MATKRALITIASFYALEFGSQFSHVWHGTGKTELIMRRVYRLFNLDSFAFALVYITVGLLWSCHFSSTLTDIE